MSIRIVEHCEALIPAVEAFNRRMQAGGRPWGFYVDPVPDWIPKRNGAQVWREFYLAVDERDEVRGGFALKPQNWLIRGVTHVVTDWQGPVSEGVIDSRFAMLAVRLIREMSSRRPALYSWGHGGNEQPVVQILASMNWLIHETPLCLLVLNPTRFLRLNRYLRSTPARRVLLDALAWSGLGSLGWRATHFAQRARFASRHTAVATEVPAFGPWADELWQRVKDRYSAIAVRDSASMNTLTPAGSWPHVVRLRVSRDGMTIGWALVMHTAMRDDARFGDLRVGSIVDCLADPDLAGEIVHAASGWLRRSGADVVVSNQSHPKWHLGFARNGYLLLQGRRLFIGSPRLRELLEPFDEVAQGLHLTNMDGHGPHAL
jgi:hypothetical protein